MIWSIDQIQNPLHSGRGIRKLEVPRAKVVDGDHSFLPRKHLARCNHTDEDGRHLLGGGSILWPSKDEGHRSLRVHPSQTLLKLNKNAKLFVDRWLCGQGGGR